EITKRTQFRLRTSATMPSAGPAILIRTGTGPGPEGFSLTSSAEGSRSIVTVRGADARGVIFGTGYLLRQFKMGRQQLELAGGLNLQNKPKIAIRGHQLGYRPKTNSYDAWDVPQWEQYIRDLAIFGSNAIELMPPRTDDALDSPHFPRPQIDMMVEMSRIGNEYAQDIWVWYPALDKDYGDPKQVEFAIRSEEH